MNEDQRQRLSAALTPRLTKYIPHTPTAKQQAGLLLPHREVLYGGAAGGGKSDWLLMGALQYVDVPRYSALILRQSFAELKLEGGLLERAWDWLGNTDAVPHDGGMSWTFGEGPKQAVLQFGYLAAPNDHLRYQGSNWQYIGFDELTHFREKHYRYLFSRLRRPDLNDDTPSHLRELIENLSRTPLRMRGATNPGGPGHAWVKQRFGLYQPELVNALETGFDEDEARKLPMLCHRPAFVREHDRVFLPAILDDNPHLDQEDYERSLAELDATTRAQLRHGRWDVSEPGEMFRQEWFPILEHEPQDVVEWIRYWDLAATEASSKNPDPDWTVGLRYGKRRDGSWVIGDVSRIRARPDLVDKRMQAVAAIDGHEVAIWIEQEPGASGKKAIQVYQRDVLPGYTVHPHAPADSKAVRARGASSKAEAGLIAVVRGAWNYKFFEEAEAFPPESDEVHDDQVDTLSGAHAVLTGEVGPPSAGPTLWG